MHQTSYCGKVQRHAPFLTVQFNLCCALAIGIGLLSVVEVDLYGAIDFILLYALVEARVFDLLFHLSRLIVHTRVRIGSSQRFTFALLQHCRFHE